ncbi:hypothetical protein [Actinomadura sp. 7K507]|uniref:hypothetical protein n=1 Tax=Actinomadura sp. 7K507 TaxID=2530365 RepID=UPI00104BB18F|nr:hypothetical protein [Actinomadura sp. 7K507]TDC93326.1 hypothetical protein E1285_10075 [Actinomadura sp. 7K507]
MTTLRQLRKTALSLLETAEESIGPGAVAFTVSGERFAALDGEGRVHLHLLDSDADEVLAAHPTAERPPRRATETGVRVPIGDVDGQQLNHWVRRAWLARAPERLAAQATAGDTVLPGEVGDLPRAIGRPATRALAGAGITTLAQVAELTDGELLAMHGVGPKAVRLLGEALAETGHRRP